MSLETLRKKLLANPKVKAHYDKMKLEFSIAKELILLRKRLGLTQKQLAEKAGIKPLQLARIESGKELPQLDTLISITESVGFSLEIRIVSNAEDES
jgi:transcriptional regulator with XRE-family HTH domain